jgi:hypothetical protein
MSYQCSVIGDISLDRFFIFEHYTKEQDVIITKAQILLKKLN